MMLTTKRSSRRSWKFHNCRLAPTLKGKLMKSSSYGPPPWWPSVHHVPPRFDYIYKKNSISSAQDFSSRCTKLTARALSTAWALATSWRSVTRSSFSSKELLSRLGTPFRWALNLWPNYSNKQTKSLSSKASHAITAGSLVLPAERGAVGLPLCQSAQL